MQDAMKLRRIHDENAQGVIEFALVSTVLMLLFLGTVDYARFLYYDVAITSAARVGAETAINHCPFASSNCGVTPTAVSDTLVLWTAYCEATPSPKLHPQYNGCENGTSSTWTPTCVGTCTNCAQDVCVSPSTRSSGTQVTVSVGYSFEPFTPLMGAFFSDVSCFAGDDTSVNHHTICAKSTGLVS
jgi:hypothetical protein